MLSYIGKKLNIPYSYTGIDFEINNKSKTPLEKKLNLANLIKDRNCRIVNADSQDPKTLGYVNSQYNIVFIDGDHSYKGVMSDIKMYGKLATDILLFHDMLGFKNNIPQAIKDSKIKINEEIIYQRKKKHMGIGISYIKNA